MGMPISAAGQPRQIAGQSPGQGRRQDLAQHTHGHHGPGRFGDPATHAAHVVQRTDADGNGQIDLATEGRQSRFAARLAQADADGDGAVTAAELTAQIQSQPQRGPAGAGGGRRGMHPRASNLDPAQLASYMIQRADADGDGAIDLATEGARGRFAQHLPHADTDGDGAVTAAELTVDVQARRARIDASEAGAATTATAAAAGATATATDADSAVAADATTPEPAATEAAGDVPPAPDVTAETVPVAPAVA